MNTQPATKESRETKLEQRLYRAIARADRLKSINGGALELLRAGCTELAIKDLERGQSV